MRNNVVCLKWGTKYPASNVNRLFGMVNRNLTVPFRFYCITDDDSGLLPEINALPVSTEGLTGWWYKLSIFSKDCYGLDGHILFLDLDVVITDNIDDLFSYNPEKICLIRDLQTNGYNSSVFHFIAGSYSHIWEDFQKDADNIMSRLHGDQDWITEQVKEAAIWPAPWIVSFKKQCQSRAKRSWGIIGKHLRKMGMLSPKGEAILPEGAKIVQFHGKPDPDDVCDKPYGMWKAAPWIKEFWQS